MLESSDHVLEYVDDYWHDVLSPAGDALIESHCDYCVTCKAALEEAKRRHAALLHVDAGAVPEILISATLQRVATLEATRARQRRWLQRAGGALAACLAVLILVHLHFANLTPSPYDVTLLGQARMVSGTPGSLRVRVVNHELASGVSGIPVVIDLLDETGGNTAQLASFTTDQQGTGSPRFQLPDWADGDYALRVTAQAPDGGQVLTRPLTLRRAWKLMLTSDRPVYQPGQVIHVRSLALHRLNQRPIAGQEAVFTISDAKGNVIFKQKEATSRFGICAVDCPLADEIIEGKYTIACQMGDTKSSLAVDVKKYVLPRFKIEVHADRPYYLANQRVRGQLHARYFFGKPVADAAVEVALENGSPVKLRTDERGAASFEFPPVSPVAGQVATRVQLVATVTDSAGQKETRRTPLVVAGQPLRVELTAEAGTLVAGVPNTIYVVVTTPDGRPARARLVISGREQELGTDDLGVAVFETTPAPGEVAFQVRAIGQDGEASRTFRLKCGEAANAFLLRTDRAVYNGGDIVHLTTVGGDDRPILVDLVKDGQTLLTESLPVTAGRGDLRIDLPADVFGTLELHAYRLGGADITGRQSRVIFVRRPAHLRVETTLERQEYRPGERARLSFRLTGAQGEPVPGALSLAAVDEAVFAVSDQTSEMDPLGSTVDPALLQPVLATAQWSPTAELPGAVEERQRFEQALFARATNQQRGMSREQFLKALLPFVENNKMVFEVLQRPDWETLLPPDYLAADARAILRNQGTLHSLIARSYPENARKTEALRTAALGVIYTIWIVFGVVALGVAVIVGITALCRYPERVFEVLVFSGVLSLFCCLMVPAFQKVREASERGMAMNNLQQIALAAENYRSVHKRFAERAPGPEGGAAGPRVREWFPETLLWRPELITDDAGRASLDLDLADSITTWRLNVGAVTTDGRLGVSQSGIKVFQPFFVELNLPVALTRNDEISVPVVVYNYLDRAQEIELKLEAAAWFTLLGEPVQRINLEPGAVRSAFYRVRARKAGRHELQVSAVGSGVADAVKRPIEVVPDGRRVEKVWNGTLDQPIDIPLTLPADAIEGSPRLLIKIAPSAFSQLVDGLDGILRRPTGCFEQTSSSTYPNILVLDYLRRVQKSAPKVEAKARQYIHLGYQRLLGFEVAGGGFDWFGHPPANRTLTAYGLMEFEDMARVHDVDAAVINRTRQWLVDQRRADGSWEPEGHVPHNLPGGYGNALARLRTTAYIGWAVYRHASPGQTDATRSFLLTHRPERIDDPYTLALAANALLVIDVDGRDAAPYLDRLLDLRRKSSDGKLVWWQQRRDARTSFYGAGPGGDVETTALAALALIEGRRDTPVAHAALAWLVTQKDASGAWPSTQATVLALKALLAGTGQHADDGERQLQLGLDSGKEHTIVVPADQAEVVKLIDLSQELSAGNHTLRLRPFAGSPAAYQVIVRYHQPGDVQQPEEPLSIAVAYDAKKLRIGDTLQVTATVASRLAEAAPMVMLELPIPAGFQVEASDFERLVETGAIARFQLQPARILVYARELPAGKSLHLAYRLRAHMAAEIRVSSALVYEYYNPARQGSSTSERLVVVP
jgi:uncharacterized protein YfaS (alpha-2-macroglobulin family)